MARPTKYTPELAEKILGYIRSGSYRETACAAAGVSSKTLRNWLKAAAAGEEPYAGFVEAMEEADAQAEARHVLTITSASKEDWRAAGFILSRRWADRWKERTDAELSGPNGGPIAIDARAALLERVHGLIERKGEPDPNEPEEE